MDLKEKIEQRIKELEETTRKAQESLDYFDKVFALAYSTKEELQKILTYNDNVEITDMPDNGETQNLASIEKTTQKTKNRRK